MALTPALAEVRKAQQILAAHFPATRMAPAPGFSRPNTDVYLKIETELPTSSFKPRGALYALARNLRRRDIHEVTACSTGNHGAAVAWAAKTLGISATIFLPSNPNPLKRQKIADRGARIHEAGGADLAHAYREAVVYSSRPGVYFLNDATDPDILAGPATIGMEILDQLPNVATVYVPMGDTALIRGVGAVLKQVKPEVKIVGVQAAGAPSYYLSWKAGRAVPTETCATCADGLATRTPQGENVQTIREIVDNVVLVGEEEMIQAIRLLYLQVEVVAEPAGAAATAAFLKEPEPRGPLVLLVSGGNISDEVRGRAGLGIT